ncbi:MAG: IMPACT family protein [Christensenellales bacterium]|jgi:uncharacterized YigZ family protein
MTQNYITLRQYGESECIINRSRFIGRAFPVQSQEQALAHHAALRKQHHDATHNCYAYRIGEIGNIARFSDDGEPQGTAGLPIMDVLHSKGATFALVVVTRYFGGVLLGANGLVRAYSRAASKAVEAAGLLSMRRCLSLSLQFGYERLGRIQSFLQSGWDHEPPLYTHQVSVRVFVPLEKVQEFRQHLADLSAGTIVPVEEGEVWRGQ